MRLRLALAALVAGAGTAAAYTGVQGDGGPPTSAAPDLITASVLDAGAGTVQACFDAIPAGVAPDAFTVTGYDSAVSFQSTAVAPGANGGRCVTVSFPAGADVGARTVLSVAAGAGIPEEAAPLRYDGAPVVDGAEPRHPGLTDGPDLRNTTAYDTGAVVFQFDEPIADTAAADAFRVIDPMGNTRSSTSPPTVSDDRLCVTVQFAPGSVTGAQVAGVSTAAGAVRDAAGNASPVGAVAGQIYSGPIRQFPPLCDAPTATPSPVQTATATPAVTPAPTATATPTGTPTASPTPTVADTKPLMSKVRVRRRGRRVSGRLITAFPCAIGRRVYLVRGRHAHLVATTDLYGHFSFRTRRRGVLRMQVRRRRIGGVVCQAVAGRSSRR